MGRSPLAESVELLFLISRLQHLEPILWIEYQSISISLADIDDMSNGGDYINVDASEWIENYPSWETVF